MDRLQRLLSRPIALHLLFWLGVIACYLISNWNDFRDYRGVLVTYGSRTILQFFTAYACLLFIVPRFLKYRRIWEVLLSLAAVIAVGHAADTLVKFLYLEPNFPENFAYCLDKYGDWSLQERIFDPKYAFFVASANLFPPAFVLVAIQHYRRQHQISELSEQKKSAELSALRNQLNPHFLFNTLNNLYVLALKKSDQTPVAISKLSDMLDHILYRSDEQFVALAREMDLLESYLALEKIRYGNRVEVVLDKSLPYEQNIAPLLLLTFLENAFKHGVSQEIGQAKISISVVTDKHGIDFRIQNTVPATAPPERSQGIGLNNVRKQLALLYPDRHRLTTERTEDHYLVSLN
ncbi:MAG: histidine kinase, partial [Bacteroidota bacterium]